jgi:hypothetical protein
VQVTDEKEGADFRFIRFRSWGDGTQSIGGQESVELHDLVEPLRRHANDRLETRGFQTVGELTKSHPRFVWKIALQRCETRKYAGQTCPSPSGRRDAAAACPSC